MNLFEAKRVLKNNGFRVIKEAADVYSEIESCLIEAGYDSEKITEMLEIYSADIEEALANGASAFEIAGILADLDDKSIDDDETEEIELGGERYEDYIDPDEYMGESKSYKGKSDKFDRKAKLAGKKKCKHCKDCDDDEDLDESLEDLGVVRGPRGQQGTEDWSDFKDEFRTKTAILKTALTNNFVSGLIKDFDFEIDNKDIREVAFDNVDAVYGTKNAVKNLQARVREYFKKMFKK